MNTHKLLIVLALALPVGLSGCAALDPTGRSILSGGSSFVATVDNPVTKQRLYQIEQGLIAVTSTLLVYKRACARQTISPSCVAIIAKIQVYTRQAEPLLVDLRRFVRTNDQISAITVYNELSGLLARINAERTANGV